MCDDSYATPLKTGLLDVVYQIKIWLMEILLTLYLKEIARLSF